MKLRTEQVSFRFALSLHLQRGIRAERMAKVDEASNNLERVTDYVEDTELDSERMAEAMSGLTSAAESKSEDQPAVKVKVNRQDIDYIVAELEIDERLARDALRRHGNDMFKALEDLILS